ncbi:prepilin peptidase [Serratia sp. NPDC078593]|uniref:prepilin peptidase n=1 Tax=unclassified Serratia (in: enterobacteria) TaxID=2647522 RepID=UPI0037D1B140
MSCLLSINFVLLVCVLMFIAWQDILFRVISHGSLLLLLIILLPLAVMQHTFPNFIAAISILVIGYALFCFNVIGGGDVKLMALLSLALSDSSLAAFLFLTACIGGLIALAGLIFFNETTRLKGIPYGVAISLAFVLALPFNTPL